MAHVHKVCECGVVLLQCRCIGSKETVYVPCVQSFITHSIASFEPISLEQLYDVYTEYLEAAPQTSNDVLKVHPSVYNAIQEYFMKKEAEEEVMGVKTRKPTVDDYLPWTIFGVQIIIDRSLEPGEWRFEDLHKTNGGAEFEIDYKKLTAKAVSGPVYLGTRTVSKRSRKPKL